MSDAPAETPAPPVAADADPAAEARRAKAVRKHARWRRVRRTIGVLILLMIAAIGVGRIYLGPWLTWYVNRVIDQNKLYDGNIKGINISLWQGEYSIQKIKLLKTTGSVASPFFECDRLDIRVDWNALRHGRVTANVYVERPKINIVAAERESESQTGTASGAGPWLGILRDLAPFEINSAVVHQGELHFQAHHTTPQVDIFLSQLNVQVTNLTNVEDRTTPLNARVDITGKAMDSGDLECHVKFNPFSYRPTFQLALRLLRLDVAKLNPFTKAYGDFDFENGYFDLVVEMNSREGMLDGYAKPLFRDLQIFGARDFKGNIFNAFYQALLGVGEFTLQNQPRDQFGTNIPIGGILNAPSPDLLTTIFNVLRNAFIRAYTPRLEGRVPDMSGLEFQPGTVLSPGAPPTGN
ncbi:MAG TPA: DUF748 domain-containing protein [Tepidisphaeraceae bacterium]|jgi:hypothetical protein